MSVDAAARDISQLVHQPSRRRSRTSARFRDRCVRGLLLACSALSVFITFTIIVVLLRESIQFFGFDSAGIVSACLLSISRAIGETMIVALAAGATARMTIDPRQEVQTMTGWIVQMCLGDASHQGMGYFSMYAVAAALFLITFSITVIGNMVRNRFREEYQ